MFIEFSGIERSYVLFKWNFFFGRDREFMLSWVEEWVGGEEIEIESL